MFPSNPTVRKLGGKLYERRCRASFVEYAVFAYGRDRLPTLLDGMHRYDTWETLIPAVYGVSAADFETGWQEYLRKDEGGRMKRAHG